MLENLLKIVNYLPAEVLTQAGKLKIILLS